MREGPLPRKALALKRGTCNTTRTTPTNLDVRPRIKDDPLPFSAPAPSPASKLPLPLAVMPRDHLRTG